jgi:hypothetical protein
MRACLAAACTLALLLLLARSPAAGEWVPAASARTCEEKLLCVGSNVTWATAHEYGAEDGCRAIASKGLTAIKFYGDSFMRHMYEGLVLTLTGALLKRHSGPTRCWWSALAVVPDQPAALFRARAGCARAGASEPPEPIKASWSLILHSPVWALTVKRTGCCNQQPGQL